ncbi:hypothetical protein M9H77_11090 [Catharanthus roseus]|uniref:Uncharacterized protein n=1 Tax=Catharanthus roseus TaxID=4058 RepID=A0ACC0BDJ8_CATRO|nr:hypothetical protein M9H77_11090 [Catharanthus roseus]
MDRFEGTIFGWHRATNIRIKGRIGKLAGHDVTGCFQLVGYPKWWPRSSPHLTTGRGIPLASNNKGWRARATDGGRPMEVWVNSASVWRGRMAAKPFSRCNLLAGDDGPSGQSTSSNGPGHFPNLIVDQWSKLMTALNNSNNTQSEKLSKPSGPRTQQPGRLPPVVSASNDGSLHSSRDLAPCSPAPLPPVQHSPRQQASSHDPAARISLPQTHRQANLSLTRPELVYAVHKLAQFMHASRRAHWDAAIRVVRYLKRSPGHGILLQSNSPLLLTAYCDSYWFTCPITRRSITGYFISLGGSPISWKTKKHTVSRSSAEAEYRSMTMTLCELKWLSILLRDLHVPITRSIPLHCDNQTALHIAENPIVILYVMLSKTILFSLPIFASLRNIRTFHVRFQSALLNTPWIYPTVIYPSIDTLFITYFIQLAHIIKGNSSLI